MANFLAVDCSTEYLQIALRKNEFTYVRSINKGLRHNEHLFPAIKSLLADEKMVPADLNGLIVARGPGSFTGLRIGMASLKAMAVSLNIPLISISVLSAMALHYKENFLPVLPSIDARSNRFYVALYDFQSIHKQNEDSMTLYMEKSCRMPSSDFSSKQICTYITQNLSEIDMKSILLVGPSAYILQKELDVLYEREITFIAQPFSPWILSMLELGIDGLANGIQDAPEQGPEYIRPGV